MPHIEMTLGWRMLRLLNFYRVALILLLASIALLTGQTVGLPGSSLSSIGGQTNQLAFLMFSALYLGAAALLIIARRNFSPLLEQQALAHIATDIVMLSLLSAASGGIRSSLGVLMLFSLASVSLIVRRPLLLTAAAFATFSMLAMESYVALETGQPPAYMQAALLGIAFLAISLTGPLLSQRVSELETLATQRAVEASQLQQFSAKALQELEDGIIAVDAQQRITLINDAASQLLNRSTPPRGTLLADLEPNLARQLQHWRKTGELQTQSKHTQNSKAYRLSCTSAAPPSRHAGVLLRLQDRAEITRTIQQEKLAAVGRLTASIAHEIRNPLNAIRQANQLLSEQLAEEQAEPGNVQATRSESAPGQPTISKATSSEGKSSIDTSKEGTGNENTGNQASNNQDNSRLEYQKILLEIVDRHSCRINNIVSSVMDLSRRGIAERQKITLGDAVSEASTALTESGLLQGDEVNVIEGAEIEGAELQLLFDPQHLQQLLTNLFANAVQHGKVGDSPLSITLTASTSGAASAVEILIANSGADIPADDAEIIFEPFHSARDSQGSGLGLFICRELAAANNAELFYQVTGRCGFVLLAEPATLNHSA